MGRVMADTDGSMVPSNIRIPAHLISLAEGVARAKYDALSADARALVKPRDFALRMIGELLESSLQASKRANDRGAKKSAEEPGK